MPATTTDRVRGEQTQAEVRAGIVPSNYSYPEGNVKRYGAAGDGVADDTVAIQTAIDILNDWSRYSTNIGKSDGSTPDFTRGGIVTFPRGIYRVTAPILLAPGIALEGEAPAQLVGSNIVGNSMDQLLTTIRASFPAGKHYYVIDSGNWRLKDNSGAPRARPYRVIDAEDQFTAGHAKDDAYATWITNIRVSNLVVDGGKTAFGGIRIQVGARFRLDNYVIQNTQYAGFVAVGSYEFGLGPARITAPIGCMLSHCESAMQDGAEFEVYSEPTNEWISVNQRLINSVFYPEDDLVGRWYGLTLKCVLLDWCINVTFGYLAANAGNVGLEFYHSNCNILHWENEYTAGGALFLLRGASKCRCDGLSTKSASPLATGEGTCQLVIREPFAIACSSSFIALNDETSSDFEVQFHNLHEHDWILGITTRLSVVNITRLFPYTGTLNLYCDAAAGDPGNDGLYSRNPTTIIGAHAFIKNNPHVREWILWLKGGQTHTLSGSHTVKDVRVTWAKWDAGAPPLVAITTAPMLDGCVLSFAQVELSYAIPAAFTVRGFVCVNIDNTSITIPTFRSVFQCAAGATARLVLGGCAPHFAFGTGSGLCSGGSNGFINYEDSFASARGSGTFALEAGTRGKVRKIASNIV